MQDSTASANNHKSSTFTSFISRNKRTTLIVASSIVAAGAFTVGVQAQNASNVDTAKQQSTSSEVDSQSNDSLIDGSKTSNIDASITAGVSGTDASTDVRVNINGHDISVPQNGSTHTTVPASNGVTDETSVDISSSTGSDNSSTSSVNVNIEASTSGSGSGFSSSHTFISQHGGSTFIVNN